MLTWPCGPNHVVLYITQLDLALQVGDHEPFWTMGGRWLGTVPMGRCYRRLQYPRTRRPPRSTHPARRSPKRAVTDAHAW